MSQPEWVDELPPKGTGTKGVWEERLFPLTQNPGRWALVFRADNPESAQSHVSNLNRRMVLIPQPTAKWEFVSRGDDVFAKFHPGRPPAPKRARRKTSGTKSGAKRTR